MFKKITKTVFTAALILNATQASAYDCADPKTYVTSVRDTVLGILNNQDSAQQKHDKLDKIFRDTADTDVMAKRVMGRNYAKLTPDQQSEFAKVYADYLSASYVDKFRQYNGGSITIDDKVGAENSDSRVNTTIQLKDKAPVSVSYLIRKSGACYKVEDINAEGVSLIFTQRDDFAPIFNGQGYDGFVNLMKQKSEQLNADVGVQN